LTALQQEVLEAFFTRETRFVLTGGAALAGYHLGHRSTHDLDLFARSNLLEEGDTALSAAAREVGGTVEKIQTSPTFYRRLVRRGDESIVVDLVQDDTLAGGSQKMKFGAVIVDPPDEILANKLCTLLSRAELRDLIDVSALDAAGFSIEHAIARAQEKDGGLTPAQLAWVLSQVTIGDDAILPAGVDAKQLRRFLTSLQSRLAKMGYPGGES
jgi:predicted nucleotidyltransferase component of viral defense system